MNSKCLNRSQHHCPHAHNCKNKEHQSAEKLNNLKRNHVIKETDEQHNDIESQQNYQCKNFNRKDKQSMFYLKITESLRQKKQRIKELEKQLKNLRNKKIIKVPQQKHTCRDKNYELMYNIVFTQNEKHKLQLEQLRTIREMLTLQLEIQRQKVKQLEANHVKSQIKDDKINHLNLEINRLVKYKKQCQSLKQIQKKYEEQNKDLKQKLLELTSIKDRLKLNDRNLNENLHKIQQKLKQNNKDKEIYKNKYEQLARNNIDLHNKLKEEIERNRINNQQNQKSSNQRVKNAQVKFDFSCKQINSLRLAEGKLKEKIKQLEHQILLMKQNPKKSEQTRVQKQLKGIYESTFKQNTAIRQKLLKLEQQVQRLKIQLADQNNRFQQQKYQLKKLLQVKQLELKEINSARSHLQKQNKKLKETFQRQIKNRIKNPLQQNKMNIIDQNKNDENKLQNHTNFQIQIQFQQQLSAAQNKILELQNQNETLRSRIKVFEKQASSNNWAQFQMLIKQSNNRIKNLIIQKGKQAQSNSYLRVQIQDLKNQLNQKRQGLPEQLFIKNNDNELRELRYQIQQKQFQLINLRRQVQNVNNKYSDYYALQSQNRQLKVKLENITETFNNLKKTCIRSSYQKQQLIYDNHYLMDELDKNYLLHRY